MRNVLFGYVRIPHRDGVAHQEAQGLDTDSGAVHGHRMLMPATSRAPCAYSGTRPPNSRSHSRQYPQCLREHNGLLRCGG